MGKTLKKLVAMQAAIIIAMGLCNMTQARAAAKYIQDGVYRAVATDSYGDKFKWEMRIEHHQFDVDWYVVGKVRNYKNDAHFGAILYQTEVVSGNRHAHAMHEFETFFTVSSKKGRYTSISNDESCEADIQYAGKNKVKVRLISGGRAEIKTVTFKYVKGSSFYPISDWHSGR